MNIRLQELIGDRCITAEQGQKLLTIIEPLLLENEMVTVDLTGVRTLLSLFLNNGIGPLFKHFDRQQLDHLLTFEHLSETQKQTLRLVLQNAEAYHRDPTTQKAIDNTLSRNLEEMD